MLAYIPNLEIGQGRSNTKSANEKQREHHKVLTEAFRELQAVCNAGGFKTILAGKTVVLKFYIAFIIGDTDGHNDLCLHFKKNADCPCRDCHCSLDELSSFKPEHCKPLTLKDIIKTDGEEESLRRISQRYKVLNALYTLPFADRLMGPHGCTPWETLHVFDQGLLQYIVESLHDIFGEKSAGKREKDSFVKLFKVLHNTLKRQSERDFPRRSVRFSPLDGSRITASELRGNCVIFILSFYVKDATLLLSTVFEKWNSQHTGSIGPSVKGCREAWTDLICYEKWVKEENSAGEVIASSTYTANVLTRIKNRFPRRQGTHQWDLQKMHGAFKMGYIQIPKHGNGSCWDSSHGERMHQIFFTRLGYNTQRRFELFATELAERRYEDMTLQTATNHMRDKLMGPGNHDDDDDEKYEEGTSAEGKWNYHDEKIPRSNSFSGMGEYSIQSNGCENGDLDFCLKWKDRDAHVIRKKVHDQLLFGLNLYAKSQRWSSNFQVTGYTSIKKIDVTTAKDVLYRSDTSFRGTPWHDWGLFYFKDTMKPVNSINMGMILGFVRFDTPGFPTPNNKALYPSGIPESVVDREGYVIARCIPGYVDIDKKFVTPVTLLNGNVSIYVIPMEDLIGPVAVVPNIYTEFRSRGEDETWLAIKPYRKWGRHFGNNIEWEQRK